MVGGMCSMLPYGSCICYYSFIHIFIIIILSVHSYFIKFLKSGIDKSEESPRYQHVLAFCAFFVCFFLTRVISDRLSLGKFVFDFCMFCFLHVSRIMWI